MSTKILVFIITMAAYLTIHLNRMILSFVNIFIQQEFGLDKRTIGFANAAVYIILGIGYLIQSIKPMKNIQLTFFVFVTISSISFGLIGLYPLIGINSKIVLFITLALFGYFQCTSWSTVFTIIMRYYSPEKDGFSIGVWTTSAELGNILGFLTGSLFIYIFKWAWQTTMWFGMFLGIVMAVGIYLLPQGHEEIEENEKVENSSSGQFGDVCSKLANIQPIYLLTQMVLLKILVYGVLLWLPLYLEQRNFKSFSGYIVIAFNVASLFGSSLMGNVYIYITSPLKRHFFFIMVGVIILFTFWGLKNIELTVSNQWVLMLLLSLMGLMVVGKYNNIVSNESMKFVEEAKVDSFVWGCTFETTGYISLGIFQIITGLATYQNDQALFVIFLVVNILALLIELLFFVYLWKAPSKEDNNQNLQQIPDNKLQID